MTTITTKSGSKYFITKKDGKTYLLNGLREYLVDSISYNIVEPLIARCQQLNPYTCEPSDEITEIRSTPVVDIR